MGRAGKLLAACVERLARLIDHVKERHCGPTAAAALTFRVLLTNGRLLRSNAASFSREMAKMLAKPSPLRRGSSPVSSVLTYSTFAATQAVSR